MCSRNDDFSARRGLAYPPGLEAPVLRGAPGLPPPAGMDAVRVWPAFQPYPRDDQARYNSPLPKSKLDDARSPEVRPACPEPRHARPAGAPLFEPGHPFFAYSPELTSQSSTPCEKKESWRVDSRPLSSVSTRDGPTPGPEDYSRQASFHSGSPQLGLQLEEFRSSPMADFDDIGYDPGGRPRRLRTSFHEREAVPGLEQREDVAAMAKTQMGSRSLQSKILKGSCPERQVILEVILHQLPAIMRDQYGNWLCSTAFQACSGNQRYAMLERAVPDFVAIAKDPWGSHAMEKLLSHLVSEAEQQLLLAVLKEHAAELSRHEKGHRVVKKAILALDRHWLDELLLVFVPVLHQVADTNYGAAVLICCFERLAKLERDLPPLRGQWALISEMARQAVSLAAGPYAHRVVQQLLQLWGFQKCRAIVQALKPQLCALSCEQHGAHVVLMMLREAPREVQEGLAGELTSPESLQKLMSKGCAFPVARQVLQVKVAERAALEAAFKANLRNPKLAERWESMRALEGTEALFGPADLSHTPPRRGRGRGQKAMVQRGSPESRGVLTPGSCDREL